MLSSPCGEAASPLGEVVSPRGCYPLLQGDFVPPLIWGVQHPSLDWGVAFPFCRGMLYSPEVGGRCVPRTTGILHPTSALVWYLLGMGSMLHTSTGPPWALTRTARAMPHAFHKPVWELPLLCLQCQSGVYNFSCILVVFGLHGLPVQGFTAKVAMPHLLPAHNRKQRLL